MEQRERKTNWLERRRSRKRAQQAARGDTAERARERTQHPGEASDTGRDAKQASIGGVVNGL